MMNLLNKLFSTRNLKQFADPSDCQSVYARFKASEWPKRSFQISTENSILQMDSDFIDHHWKTHVFIDKSHVDEMILDSMNSWSHLYHQVIAELLTYPQPKLLEAMKDFGPENASFQMDPVSEQKGLEWLKVSLSQLTSALDQVRQYGIEEGGELILDGIFQLEREPDRQSSFKWRLILFNLDCLAVVLKNGALRIAVWDKKNQETFPENPAFSGDFFYQRHQVFDLLIQLTSQLGRFLPIKTT